MELEDTMASLKINDNAPPTGEFEEESDPPESVPRQICPSLTHRSSPEKRRVVTKPIKLGKDSSLSNLENYYLDKRVKRLSPLETIFEETPQYKGNEMNINSRRIQLQIKLPPGAPKSVAKVKKKVMKVKRTTAANRVNNKITMKILVERLSRIPDE